VLYSLDNLSRKYNYTQVAKRAGVAETTISRLRNRHTPGDAETIAAISTALRAMDAWQEAPNTD